MTVDCPYYLQPDSCPHLSRQKSENESQSVCEYFRNCPGHYNDICKINKPMSHIMAYRKEYCYNNPQECARYQVSEALSREQLPPDLLPDDIKRANYIIDEN